MPSVRLPENSGTVFSLQSQNCHPKSTLLACQSQAAFQKWVQKNFFSFFRIGHFKNVHFQNFLKSLFRKFLEKNESKQYKERTERLSLIDSSTLIVYHYSNNSKYYNDII